MFQQEPQQPSLTDRLRGTANRMAFVASVFATFAEVALFRKHFGERYFQGLKTGLVVPLILFFPVFFPNEDPRPLLAFLPLYLIMCVLHRIDIVRRRRRGKCREHSLFNGVSKLEHGWPGVSELTLKCRHEPLVMLGMGVVALLLSPPMAWFFICCSAGMAVHAGLLAAHERQRALDLADAHLDGHRLMNQPETRRVMTGPVVWIHPPGGNRERSNP